MKLFAAPVRGQKLHFVGVGGIGMSGLAQVLATAGATVSGSDSGSKGDFSRLEAAGVTVQRQHAAANVGDAERVVVSTAIAADNPELREAKARGIPVVHRAVVLAEIMKNYQTIAVSGTHGKTSTTALIYSGLAQAGVNVGVINGGVLNALGTNALLPKNAKDAWLVVEADESDASFLQLQPTIAVVTNVEAEHMETYGGDEVKLVQAFVDFADSAEMAVVCADDANARLVAERTASEVFTYGLEDDADVVGSQLGPSKIGMVFDANVRGAVLDEVQVALPGEHYVRNSLAALTVASVLQADLLKVSEGLATFAGVGRRFTVVGQFHGAQVIDDYGHHPTEIAATLAAAKLRSTGQLVAVIEPHRFSRLHDLMEEFAACVSLADAVVLLPVYAAGETPLPGVSHTVLGEKMVAKGVVPEVVVIPAERDPVHELVRALHHLQVGTGDVVLCLGAGTITDFAKKLAQHHHHH